MGKCRGTKRDVSNFALSTSWCSTHCLFHLRQPPNLQWWLPVREQNLWCILQCGSFPRIDEFPQKYLPKNMINLFPKHCTENDGDAVVGWGNVNCFFLAVVDCCKVASCGWRGCMGPFEGGGRLSVEFVVGCERFFEGGSKGVSFDQCDVSD